MPGAQARVESSLSNLTLSDNGFTSKPSLPVKKSSAIADSWEDELSSGEDTETAETQVDKNVPLAPPPTPVSPVVTRADLEWSKPYASQLPDRGRGSPESPSASSSRPEKQTAVAGRLIAGALGIRAPKKTEEQKAYDRAVKDKEMRKRQREQDEQERAKEESERAKAAIWGE
ncbi:MAG: hypothetical protein M1827_006434 [Pycnora praestabilis]|nr:MAG: hypothetical protein M1827_006434 [Pycnora praestabilis]